jgi:hypothetical protein
MRWTPSMMPPTRPSSALERFPIRWNHLIGKESLRFNELEHVLMRHRIYPMSKYRKRRSTFSEHALVPASSKRSLHMIRTTESCNSRSMRGFACMKRHVGVCLGMRGM